MMLPAGGTPAARMKLLAGETPALLMMLLAGETPAPLLGCPGRMTKCPALESTTRVDGRASDPRGRRRTDWVAPELLPLEAFGPSCTRIRQVHGRC
jgi:hypothetical protein